MVASQLLMSRHLRQSARSCAVALALELSQDQMPLSFVAGCDKIIFREADWSGCIMGNDLLACTLPCTLSASL